MSELKVLYAFSYRNGNTVIVKYIKDKMDCEMSVAGMPAGKIDVVGTKQQIEDKLDAESYDVLIVKEQLGEDKISSGSIKGWSQRYPNLKVFLCVDNDKKGGEKLLKLLSNPPYYYNALYNNDLTGENIVKLISSPRSKEEAILYYGLEKRMEEEKAKEESNAAPVVVEEKVEETVVETVVEVPTPEEPVKEEVEEEQVEVVPAPVVAAPEVTAQELDELSAEFAGMEFEKMLDEVLEGGEEPETEMPVEAGAPENAKCDFDVMFSGTDLFGDSSNVQEVVVEEFVDEEDKQDVIEIESVDDELPPVVEAEGYFEEPEKLTTMKDIFKTALEDVLPEEGRVLKVFDYNTMLVELTPAPYFTSGKSLEDYKMLFVVKGTKGGFVGGKYKVGVKSFEGYAGSLLGKQTVIVEVPEYDLIANQLNGAECSIICIEQ